MQCIIMPVTLWVVGITFIAARLIFLSLQYLGIASVCTI